MIDLSVGLGLWRLLRSWKWRLAMQ